MRILNRMTAHLSWVGGMALALGWLVAVVPMARASTLDPSLLPNVEAATFEVVAAKPTHPDVTYADTLPVSLIPYQKRTDKYHSIGTAFAIGPNRYVTAGHVLRAGLNSLWGPLELRDAKGHVYAIGKILKFSLRRDFAVFTLKHPPEHQATLPVDTDPRLNAKVYAVGNALGTGIVIRGGLYTSKTPEGQSGAWDWLRFSAAASPGNSGGPLLNSKGQVLGVVLMMNPNGNLNYALPISQVLDAPRDKAVMNKRANYGFPLIQDTHVGTFKAHFALPMSLAKFNATFLKYRHAYVDGQLKALLAANADTLFPHGKGAARLLYAAPTKNLFPRLLTRRSNGQWSLSVKKSPKIQLADNGFLRLGVFPDDRTHIVLFRLRKPDNVPAKKLYGHPGEIMRLVLKAGFLKRHIKSSQTRVTSLGKPLLNAVHTDTWQRHWRVAVWPIPYANGLWMMCALPVPDGYVGFFSFAKASHEHDYLINLEAMTNYFYNGYEGTLSQWQDFLQQTRLLPAAFQHIQLDVQAGDYVRYRSPRLGFKVTSGVQKVDADSKLALMFSFFRDQGNVVWGVSNVLLKAKPHGKDTVGIFRYPDPEGNPSASYKAAWNKVLHRRAPNNSEASRDNDTTMIIGVAGGTAASKPDVLYAVADQQNGQHPQQAMKSRLDALMKNVHVYEH